MIEIVFIFGNGWQKKIANIIEKEYVYTNINKKKNLTGQTFYMGYPLEMKKLNPLEYTTYNGLSYEWKTLQELKKAGYSKTVLSKLVKLGYAETQWGLCYRKATNRMLTG